MGTWLEAGTYCEEVYGITMNTKEGYFVCPECGEPIFEEDWGKHDDWTVCPVCGGMFEEG
jgi:uncharacterized Zn finger protein (UPF0148 family)